MKKLVFSILAIVCLSFLFQSCSDSDELNNEPFFQAQIDGLDYYVSGEHRAYVANFSISTNIYGVLDITAESMYIQLPQNISEGTYQFSEDVFAYYTIGDRTWSSKLGSGEGSITITRIDGINISGTFSYTAVDFDNSNSIISVTNGKFNVLNR